MPVESWVPAQPEVSAVAEPISPMCTCTHTDFHTPPTWASTTYAHIPPGMPLHIHRSSCLEVRALSPGHVFPGEELCLLRAVVSILTLPAFPRSQVPTA